MSDSEVSKSFSSQFKRILEIDKLLRNNSYPTKKILAKKLGICERQIERLLNLMKEDFGAPIYKNPKKDNGFYYGLEGFSITNISYTENETFALHFCNNFLRRTLVGSGISQKIENGLSTLQNLSESYDNDEGSKLANRIHFAMNTNRLNQNIKSNQESLEETLLNAIKEGELLKISVKNWKDDSVVEKVGLPIFIAMHKDFCWFLVYIEKDAFSEDFSSINKLSLNHINVVNISYISALSICKNTSAKQICIKNQFSYLGESPVYETENFTKEGLICGIGVCFSLIFPVFLANKTYKIFAHFFIDNETLEYQLDKSIEYEILDDVFYDGEDKLMKE